MRRYTGWALLLLLFGSLPIALHGGVIFVSPDVPKPIWDFNTTYSTVNVPPLIVGDVNVIITELRHSFMGDLHIWIRSPLGTTVFIYGTTVGFGPGGDDMINTVFDDSATLPLSSAVPPYTGTFQPVNPLSAFVGENAGGLWTLIIDDRTVFDEGQLISWALDITPLSGGGGPQPIPEPATALLVATGLAGAVVARRRFA
jgi:subtilisin-like proprotein convertase family protein